MDGQEYPAKHALGEALDPVAVDDDTEPLFESTGPPSDEHEPPAGTAPMSSGDPEAVETSADDGPEPRTASSADQSDVRGSDSGSLVRPYTRTGGRTRTDIDLAIETLVVTSDTGKVSDAARNSEHRSICELCRTTRSVAEVSAHLRLPLGVTKVLVGDLATMGLVLIHHNDILDDQPSIGIMERVLSGLRRL